MDINKAADIDKNEAIYAAVDETKAYDVNKESETSMTMTMTIIMNMIM